jgi:hypothetical protein
MRSRLDIALKCCEESVIWKTMESFLLKTTECLQQTRQFEEKVTILKQKDDEFFKGRGGHAKNSSTVT